MTCNANCRLNYRRYDAVLVKKPESNSGEYFNKFSQGHIKEFHWVAEDAKRSSPAKYTATAN